MHLINIAPRFNFTSYIQWEIYFVVRAHHTRVEVSQMSSCDDTAITVLDGYSEAERPCLLTLCHRKADSAHPTGHQACSWSLPFFNKRPLEAFFQVTDGHSRADRNLVKGHWSTRGGATPTMRITAFWTESRPLCLPALNTNTDWSEIQCVICFARQKGQ